MAGKDFGVQRAKKRKRDEAAFAAESVETSMTIEEAKKKLQEYGQEHVLHFFDELSGKEREELLAQIDRTDFHILENSKNRGKELPRGEFSPLSCMEIPEIRRKTLREQAFWPSKKGRLRLVSWPAAWEPDWEAVIRRECMTSD